MTLPRPSSPPSPLRPEAPPASADACPPGGRCITCSDEAIAVRVLAVDRATGLATCGDERGTRTEVLTALVDDVHPGDVLLVHAGTALLRLESSDEGPG